MFERFTDRARRVVVLAQEEARMLNHNYIGTEHILLGLIHEGEGVAAKALESLGIALEGVRAQVEEIIGQGQQAPSGHIPFTPRAKKVLELSLREALQLGHNSLFIYWFRTVLLVTGTPSRCLSTALADISTVGRPGPSRTSGAPLTRPLAAARNVGVALHVRFFPGLGAPLATSVSAEATASRSALAALKQRPAPLTCGGRHSRSTRCKAY